MITYQIVAELGFKPVFLTSGCVGRQDAHQGNMALKPKGFFFGGDSLGWVLIFDFLPSLTLPRTFSSNLS